MMPHIHLIFGMTCLNAFQSSGLTQLNAILFLIGNLIPDSDFIIARKLKRNHREMGSHYPLLWLMAGILSMILQLPVLWFFWGGFFHVILDTLDWEVILFGPLLPYSFSILSLQYTADFETYTIVQILREYYSDKRILFLEAIFFLVYVLSLLTR
ncbi:MAG: metal-dependent hydrolase [Candidatus Thorarchaeota archaeon]